MYFDLHNNPKRWYYPHFPVEETDSESQATSQGCKAIVNSRARTRTIIAGRNPLRSLHVPDYLNPTLLQQSQGDLGLV